MAVEESISLAEVNDEECKLMLIGHTNADQFYASLCYADAAFKSILSGFVLDCTEDQYWLTSDAEPIIKHRFNRVSKRSSQELTFELLMAHQAVPEDISLDASNKVSGHGFYLN